MEANQQSSANTSVVEGAQINESRWVSPEVSAAEAGQQVQMGKELPSNEELDEINSND